MIYWDLLPARADPCLWRGEPPGGLLSPAERDRFESLRTPKRRRDWLLGRAVGKRLCGAWLARGGHAVEPDDIEIGSAPDGAPFAAVVGRGPLDATLSLSHRGDFAVAALVAGRDAPLGADIELCEERSSGFAADFFTARELASVEALPRAERAAAETEIWSLKESALKALRCGLRADTRTVETKPRRERTARWGEARIVAPAARGGRAFVRTFGNYVISVVWLGAEPVGEPELGFAKGEDPDELTS